MHKTNVECIKKVYNATKIFTMQNKITRYKISVFTMQIKWLKCKIKIVDQYKKSSLSSLSAKKLPQDMYSAGAYSNTCVYNLHLYNVAFI